MTTWIRPDDLELDPNHPPEEDGILRAKWTIDGAETLSEAAAMLRTEALSLEAMEKAGWQLQEPVEDDYGFLSFTGKKKKST